MGNSLPTVKAAPLILHLYWCKTHLARKNGVLKKTHLTCLTVSHICHFSFFYHKKKMEFKKKKRQANNRNSCKPNPLFNIFFPSMISQLIWEIVLVIIGTTVVHYVRTSAYLQHRDYEDPKWKGTNNELNKKHYNTLHCMVECRERASKGYKNSSLTKKKAIKLLISPKIIPWKY